jgi:ABC-2 type transport system permease protein
MTLRGCLSHLRTGVRTGLQYRFHILINFLALPVSLTVFYFLWSSIYGYSGAARLAGFSLPDLVAYYVLSMVLGLVVWSDVDAWMESDVRMGEAIGSLLLPGTYMGLQFWTEMGVRLLSFAISAAPILLLGTLAFGITLPLGLMIVPALVSLMLAMLLYFLLSYIVGLGAFWLKRVQALRRVKRAVILFFSGGMIPLAFFPSWWLPISKVLPFEYIRAVPLAIYQHNLQTTGWTSVWTALLAQLAWVVALYLLAKWMEQRAFLQLEGAGT